MEEIIKSYFTREIINDKVHNDRLSAELNILKNNDFLWFLKRFIEIFNSDIKQHLYLLRGSAGSSLLLYYLGINQIDPVKYNITLSRFLNPLASTIPDFDIDLPMNSRDKIIEQIVTNHKDTVRISCNLNNEDNEYFDNLIKEVPTTNQIHNSGIVIFAESDRQIIDENRITPTQIKLTKDDVTRMKLKKIDLLSNTGMEQLHKIHNEHTFDYNFDDSQVYDFMLIDDGTGITYAETSLIQYVIKILKPKNIEQLSICMAIVRPFAIENINKHITFDKLKNCILYDDDLIHMLVNKLNISEEESDRIRRMFKKNIDTNGMNQVRKSIDELLIDNKEKYMIKKMLSKAKMYGFCKAHSINYARLIYMLYYCKYHYPKTFWKSTIMTIKGYYNDWVYIRKGINNGLKFKGIQNCDPFIHFIYTGYWLNNDFMTKCYLKVYDIPEQSINITSNKDEINDCDDTIDNYFIKDKQTTEDVHEIVKLNHECEFSKNYFFLFVGHFFECSFSKHTCCHCSCQP